jgi:hypothetical protein
VAERRLCGEVVAGGVTTAQSGSTTAMRGRQRGGQRMPTPLAANGGSLQAVRRMADGGGDVFWALSKVGSGWFMNLGGFHRRCRRRHPRSEPSTNNGGEGDDVQRCRRSPRTAGERSDGGDVDPTPADAALPRRRDYLEICSAAEAEGARLGHPLEAAQRMGRSRRGRGG